MVFNSFQFLWLFPLIWLVYYGVQKLAGRKLIPTRTTNYLLLVLSYLLYLQFNPAYALVLLWVTLSTYLSALALRPHNPKHRKLYLSLGIIVGVAPLLVFKYYNFILSSITDAAHYFGIEIGMPGLNWAVPLGISFFSFQAIGYVCDVYHKRIEAETNLWDYMLFVAFFPQILSGPISKAASLLPQIKGERTFDAHKAEQGLKYILWGYFLKIVLADRIGVYVDTIYAQYSVQNGITCLLTSILYSFQIYGDFAGYSLMAIGTGKVLGFDLINNFNRPYLSASVTEFWRRWHISLSLWLKDYIYIPLGGSRKGEGRTYLNIIITFLVSGIWHGANWTFVVWGLLHGIFQTIEKALRLQSVSAKGFVRWIRIAFTFMLVTFAWIFFRMPTLESAWTVISKIFTQFGREINWASASINQAIVFVALLILALKSLVEEKGSKVSLINHKNIVVRYSTYVFLIAMILLCGVLNSSSFIYANF